MANSDDQAGPKVGLYVDVANIAQNGGRGMRYDVLREFACRGGGEAVRLNAYSSYDSKRAETDAEYRESRQNIHWGLRDRGYKVIEKPVKWYQNEYGKPVPKANIDLDLAVDALLQSDKLDRVVLATGDGDFVQVVRALQNKGCRVEVLAFDNVSGDLRREADLFFSGYFVPNLLPMSNSSSGGPAWGELGGVVRGSCYYFNIKEGYGFIRYLDTVSADLWNMDTRLKGSPYKSAYVHANNLPTTLDLRWIPSRNIIFEFQIVPGRNANNAEAVEVRWVNASAGQNE